MLVGAVRRSVGDERRFKPTLSLRCQNWLQVPVNEASAVNTAFPAAPLSARVRQNASSVAARVEIVRQGAPERSEVENFIRASFAAAYGARLHHFLPELMRVRDAHRVLLAALGLRTAGSAALFLEQYLEIPIERALAATLDRDVARAGLVEVGNLAVAHAGGTRWLIAALTAYLKGAGLDWAVFTAVPALRNAFARMGIELVAIAPADPRRLAAAERAQWGRYYETGPWVMAANVHRSFDSLTAFLRRTGDRYRLLGLWKRAYAAGIFAEAAPA